MDCSDISLHPGGLELTLELAEKTGLMAGENLLDIGCGTGCSLAALSEKYGIVPFGIDISEKTIAAARSLHPDISFACADAAHLSFDNASFDAVLMECVITLLEKPEQALTEAARVLRPGGKLMLSALVNTVPQPGSGSRPVRGGLLRPEQFKELAEALGFVILCEEDRKDVLIQFLAESIFEYGSLEERIHAESEQTGACTLDCRIKYNPKTASYACFILKKTA